MGIIYTLKALRLVCEINFLLNICASIISLNLRESTKLVKDNIYGQCASPMMSLLRQKYHVKFVRVTPGLHSIFSSSGTKLNLGS